MIVREATAADEAALRALAAASPDGGAVTFRREQHVPAGQVPSAHGAPGLPSAGAPPG